MVLMDIQRRLNVQSKFFAVMAALTILAGPWALAARDRPIMVLLPDGPARAEALAAWSGGVGRDFDCLMNRPGSAAPWADLADLTVSTTGLWAKSLDDVLENVDDAPTNLRWIICDYTPGDAQSDGQRLRALAEEHEWLMAFVLDDSMSESALTTWAGFFETCLIPVSDIPSEGAMADALRETTNAVVKANSQCRVGISLTGAPPQGEAMIDGYNVTREFITYHAMAWPEDDATFAATLTGLNEGVERTQRSQGMYANTMTAPEQALDPEAEQWLRKVLPIASVVFLAALTGFAVRYKGPGETRGEK
jgi:hypothetical protein